MRGTFAVRQANPPESAVSPATRHTTSLGQRHLVIAVARRRATWSTRRIVTTRLRRYARGLGIEVAKPRPWGKGGAEALWPSSPLAVRPFPYGSTLQDLPDCTRIYLKVGSVCVVEGVDARGMEADTTFACYPEIDERFFGDWIEFGMLELNAYLASHARFARFCDEREAPGFRRLESAIFRVGQEAHN
jgi:hypothetical protein